MSSLNKIAAIINLQRRTLGFSWRLKYVTMESTFDDTHFHETKRFGLVGDKASEWNFCHTFYIHIDFYIDTRGGRRGCEPEMVGYLVKRLDYESPGRGWESMD
jgi:hypothetical protein